MWFHKRFDFFQMLLDQARMSEEGLKTAVRFHAHAEPGTGTARRADRKKGR